jgi:hypothetical protein
MTDMKFPCEMETIDTIPMPKRVSNTPVKAGTLNISDVEFHQPYLIPTSEIPFNGADLRNTHWAGTCLNAVSKITGQVESRLNFEGAKLDGADFTNAWLLHPVTQKHLGMREAIQLCIQPEEHLNLLQKMQQATLIKHMAGIFGNSLDVNVASKPKNPFEHPQIQERPPVKTSVDEEEANLFRIEISKFLDKNIK